MGEHVAVNTDGPADPARTVEEETQTARILTTVFRVSGLLTATALLWIVLSLVAVALHALWRAFPGDVPVVYPAVIAVGVAGLITGLFVVVRPVRSLLSKSSRRRAIISLGGFRGHHLLFLTLVLSTAMVPVMSRIARAVAPGFPHHVTQRGNRRMDVFFCDGDYALYVDLMSSACRERGV